MKPKLTVRFNEGGKSLFRRAKTKLLPDQVDRFKLYEQVTDLNNIAQVLDALERFFELEFKK